MILFLILLWEISQRIDDECFSAQHPVYLAHDEQGALSNPFDRDFAGRKGSLAKLTHSLRVAYKELTCMKLAEGLYFYEESGFDPRLLLPDCNTYILKDEITVLVDIGLENFLPDLVREMQKDGMDPKDVDVITNTHFHTDHCQANEAFRKVSEAKFMIYDKAKKYLPNGLKTNLVFTEKLKLNNTSLEILHTPGHTPESICIYWPDKKALICGDLIFLHGVGRTDLGGDPELLRQSIRHVSKLDVEILLPGHGEVLRGKESVVENFYYIETKILPYL